MDKQNTVVVVGSGLMGTGIAHAFIASGYGVSLVDTNGKALAKARANIEIIVNEGVKRAKLTRDEADLAMGRLNTADKLSQQHTDALLLIETVSENIAIKKAVVSEASSILSHEAIIATNTSAMSVTDIASVADRPERVIGMHFFNPVHKMKLVELVLGIATDEKTVALSQQWCDAIGKTAILVNESPGLTTSRMSAMLGNEAMWMLQEGTATAEDIDTALRLGLNHPMGPLELGDLTGWDTRLSVLNYLHATLGEKFRPCPLIAKMVAAGRLGRKTEQGVYRYDDRGQKVMGSGLRGTSL